MPIFASIVENSLATLGFQIAYTTRYQLYQQNLYQSMCRTLICAPGNTAEDTASNLNRISVTNSERILHTRILSVHARSAHSAYTLGTDREIASNQTEIRLCLAFSDIQSDLVSNGLISSN